MLSRSGIETASALWNTLDILSSVGSDSDLEEEVVLGAWNDSLPTGKCENPSDNCISAGTGDVVTDEDDNAVDRDVLLMASVVDVTF